ncbi:hypothetical protein VKT23_020520 [Stygiomarasmius scandens]|uniref:Uncharacterized protein n=1 Tax=Marasmiellus scandens TaxID=2682957 RepID=A0ABR1IIX0_9AGAR
MSEKGQHSVCYTGPPPVFYNHCHSSSTQDVHTGGVTGVIETSYPSSSVIHAEVIEVVEASYPSMESSLSVFGGMSPHEDTEYARKHSITNEEWETLSSYFFGNDYYTMSDNLYWVCDDVWQGLAQLTD